jgi:hypothetical protein
MTIFTESALSHIWRGSRTRSILNNLKIHCHAVLVPAVACILASSGCSSIDDVSATRAETINFATGTEHGKPENPRVQPGRPYTQEIWLDL